MDRRNDQKLKSADIQISSTQTDTIFSLYVNTLSGELHYSYFKKNELSPGVCIFLSDDEVRRFEAELDFQKLDFCRHMSRMTSDDKVFNWSGTFSDENETQILSLDGCGAIPSPVQRIVDTCARTVSRCHFELPKHES